MKVEVKEESFYDNDVLAARYRLRLALRQLTQQEDSGGSSQDEQRNSPRNVHPLINKRPGSPESSAKKVKFPLQRKDPKRKPPEKSEAHTYIMKLFDRSVDLAKFKQDTPLYPVCRAWIQYKPPGSQTIEDPPVSNSPELDPKLDYVYKLSCEKRAGEDVPRVPSPLPEQTVKDRSLEFLNGNYVPSKDDLMSMHMARWMRVRNKWYKQMADYEAVYDEGNDVLKKMYNREIN